MARGLQVFFNQFLYGLTRGFFNVFFYFVNNVYLFNGGVIVFLLCSVQFG